MSHTPGPWRMEEFRKGSYLVTARNAGTAREGIVAQHVPGIANARLIAAAPELYEAIQAVDMALTGQKTSLEEWANINKIVRAAFAKARGDEGEDNA